jgi:hypothetical protein
MGAELLVGIAGVVVTAVGAVGTTITVWSKMKEFRRERSLRESRKQQPAPRPLATRRPVDLSSLPEWMSDHMYANYGQLCSNVADVLKKHTSDSNAQRLASQIVKRVFRLTVKCARSSKAIDESYFDTWLTTQVHSQVIREIERMYRPEEEAAPAG